MKQSLVAYFTTALAFCILDFIWLTMVAQGFYQSQIGALLLAKPNLGPALAFYLLYVVGLIVFCVLPALDAQSWGKAMLLGALFGACAYATYDLSNLATLKGWTTTITLVDIAWGSTVSALSTTFGYFSTNFVTRITA